MLRNIPGISVLFIVFLLTKNQKPDSEPFNLINSVKIIKYIIHYLKSKSLLISRKLMLFPSINLGTF